MLMRTLCRKTIKKGTPNSPMNGGQGVEVSKTLFYKSRVRLRAIVIIITKTISTITA